MEENVKVVERLIVKQVRDAGPTQCLGRVSFYQFHEAVVSQPVDLPGLAHLEVGRVVVQGSPYVCSSVRQVCLRHVLPLLTDARD